MSTTGVDSDGGLEDLSAREDLPLEWLDREGITLAVESNPNQSLIFVEFDDGPSVATAVGREDVTLAEAIEFAADLDCAVSRLRSSPFAVGGGGRFATDEPQGETWRRQDCLRNSRHTTIPLQD